VALKNREKSYSNLILESRNNRKYVLGKKCTIEMELAAWVRRRKNVVKKRLP